MRRWIASRAPSSVRSGLYGKDGVGVFGGGGLTNEKAYLLGKFARVGAAALRRSITTAGFACRRRPRHPSRRSASTAAFRFRWRTSPDAETILLVGSNLAETMPPVMQYFEEQKKRGGSLIVVDPRLTPTAAAATLHLQITPGTDAALANGLLHIAIKEGYIDEAFIAERTRDFELVRRARRSPSGRSASRGSPGIPEHQLRRAAELLGRAKTAIILTARGPEQQSQGVNNVLAFINLALALGKAGKPYCGYGCLTGQGNGQGGREHGQKADQLPGYRKLDNPEHRAFIAGVWGIAESDLPQPGRSAYEMLDTMGTRRRRPRASGLRLEHRGFRAARRSYRAAPRRARLSDGVRLLSFGNRRARRRGSSLGAMGRRRRHHDQPRRPRHPAATRHAAAGGCSHRRGDRFLLLAERLGYGRFFPSQPAEVFEELRRASAGGVADYSGITWERIRQRGRNILAVSRRRPSGHAAALSGPVCAPRTAEPVSTPSRSSHAMEEPDDEFPLYLTTGRIMAQYQSGTQTRRIAALMTSAPEAFVQIHPSMARTYGIADGDRVSLTTRRGNAEMKAQLTPSIRMDTLFVPFHFGGAGRANLLTNPALDPISRMPEFKVCAVRIEKGNTC